MRVPDRWFLACAALSAILTLLVGREVLCSGKTLAPTDLLTSREPWAPPDATDAHVRNHLHQDILEFFVLHAIFTSRALREGESLLWNPDLFCGLPVVWDPQLGTFYPPRLALLAVLPPLAAFDLLLLLHLFLAGPAFFACARAHGAGGPAAFVASILWMLCGQQMVWFKYGCGGPAAVFLPLVAWALCRAARDRSLPWAAGAGALWAVMFTGANPQLSFLGLVWAALWLGLQIRPRGGRWTAASAAVFGVSGAGLAMIQLWPFLAGLLDSARGLFPDTANFSKPWRTPLLLLTLVWPRAFGSPIDRLDLTSSWLGSNFFEFQGYMGLITIAAAAWGWTRARGLSWTAVALLAIASLYPAWWLLTQIAPVLAYMGPHRLYLYAFILAILAALGLDRALERAPGAGWLRLAGAAAGLLSSQVWEGCSFPRPGSRWGTPPTGPSRSPRPAPPSRSTCSGRA